MADESAAGAPPRIKVYLAWPYTRHNPSIQIQAAVRMADRLLGLGYAPFIPHLPCLWYTPAPTPCEQWAACNLDWLAACDLVLRLPGRSSVAEHETAAAARDLGIPVLDSIEALEHARGLLEGRRQIEGAMPR